MSGENNIPKHWGRTKASEVGILLRGINYKKQDASSEAKKDFLPVLRGNNINGELNFEDLVFVPKQNVNEEQLIKAGDIVFAMSSGSKHLVGKSAKARTDFIGSFGAFCGVFRPNENFDKDFVAYFFQSPYYKKIISEISKGTNINNLKREHILDLDFPVPPLPEQQTIVSKIEELFSELENGKQQLQIAQQQLKVYRQSLLKWAFEGKLTNKNLKDGELPKGWKWVKLGDVAIKMTKKALPADYPNAKFIGMDCIEPHTTKPAFTYKFSEFKSAGNYFEEGQVLYGRMRPYLNKVYRAEYDGTCSGEFIILQCTENFNPDLFKYILHSREFVNFANNKTNGDRPRISFEEIADYPILLAPLKEQQLIVSELESKLTVCDKIEETISQSLQQAETLRQSILKKAFEGKLVQ